MAPTEEQLALAKALIDKYREEDDNGLTKDQRHWVKTGSEHVDAKDFPLLGTFMSILRRAVLWFFLLIMSALLLHGAVAAFGTLLNKFEVTNHATAIGENL